MRLLSKQPTAADELKNVAIAALLNALDESRATESRAKGLTGVRALATGVVIYTAGRAAFKSRFVREQLASNVDQHPDEDEEAAADWDEPEAEEQELDEDAERDEEEPEALEEDEETPAEDEEEPEAFEEDEEEPEAPAEDEEQAPA
jgi:hypothetical protein